MAMRNVLAGGALQTCNMFPYAPEPSIVPVLSPSTRHRIPALTYLRKLGMSHALLRDAACLPWVLKIFMREVQVQEAESGAGERR